MLELVGNGKLHEEEEEEEGGGGKSSITLELEITDCLNSECIF